MTFDEFKAEVREVFPSSQAETGEWIFEDQTYSLGGVHDNGYLVAVKKVPDSRSIEVAYYAQRRDGRVWSVAFTIRLPGDANVGYASIVARGKGRTLREAATKSFLAARTNAEQLLDFIEEVEL